MKLMSSSTCSRGSPPMDVDAEARRAGRHLLGSCRAFVVPSVGRSESGWPCSALTSAKCRPERVRRRRRRRAPGARRGSARGARPTRSRSAPGAITREVGPREGLERAPQLRQRPVVGELDDPAVEPRVRLGDRAAVARQRRRLHVRDVPGELVDRPRRQARDGEPRAELLERRADDVGLEQLAAGRPPDAGAAERRDLDDAEGLEAAERLADRRLAGAELARDLRLDDPRVRAGSGRSRIPSSSRSLTWSARTQRGSVPGGHRPAALRMPDRRDGRRRGGSAAAGAPGSRPTPADPSTRIRSPVAIRCVASDVPMTAGMPNSRASTAGCERRAAGVRDEAGDLGEQHDPGRVGHLAHEDVAVGDLVELVDGPDDPRDALDHARRPGDAGDPRPRAAPTAPRWNRSG